MSYVLPEQFVQKVLTQGACRPGCSDADTQRAQIPDDKASDEEVHKIKNQAVNVIGEGRAVLACGLLIKFGCRLAEYQSHQR
jgi:hypothetical protein